MPASGKKSRKKSKKTAPKPHFWRALFSWIQTSTLATWTTLKKWLRHAYVETIDALVYTGQTYVRWFKGFVWFVSLEWLFSYIDRQLEKFEAISFAKTSEITSSVPWKYVAQREWAYFLHIVDKIARFFTLPLPDKPIKIRHSSGLVFSTSKWWKRAWDNWLEKWDAFVKKSQRQKKRRRKARQQAWQELFSKIQPWKPAKRKRGRPPKKKPLDTFYWVNISISFVITACIVGASYGIYSYVFKDLPEIETLTQQQQPLTTRILDRNGNVLFKLYEDENRTLIRLDALPQHVIDATIAIEDKDFYTHHGFSIQGILRAFVSNLREEDIQGGSTITQQLVKNRLLSPEQTIRRKLRELVLAILVDSSYTKDQILEMYLNTVAYGGSVYGIEEAAQRYFGKSAYELNLAEASFLAGLPAAPSAYNPFGPHPERAYVRQAEVLRRMIEDGSISQAVAIEASEHILDFQPNIIDIQAPHFVMYIQSLLAEEYGEDMVQTGGLEVTTSLDLPLQNEAQTAVTTEVENLGRLSVSNGAALVTNPKTGEILAMIGSKNYFDASIDGSVNVTLRPRQPGSSIKPLTYALAFAQGKTPYSTIDDSPITYRVAGSPPYSPRNYDGRFHGRVTLMQALASSYNIPAVKLLAEVGVNNFIDKAQEMGIDTWGDRSRFGLSLTLGGGEVLMTDMTELYGTFANLGYTVPLNPILEVKDSYGNVLYRNTCALETKQCPGDRSLDPRVASQITSVLKSNQARTPAFGSRSVLDIPGQEVAVKTGTTNSLRDNWTIGYTTDRLVAVWVGNNDNTPMSNVASGITGASPIWNNIIRLLLDENDPHTFATPEGMKTVEICLQTGTLTCASCPTTIEANFVPGTEPTRACNPAYFNRQPENADDNPGDQILDGITF